jgi:hypothetical protein
MQYIRPFDSLTLDDLSPDIVVATRLHVAHLERVAEVGARA